MTIIGILAGALMLVIDPQKQQEAAEDTAIKGVINKTGLNTQGFISAYNRYPNEKEFFDSMDDGTVSQKDGNACEVVGAPDKTVGQ